MVRFFSVVAVSLLYSLCSFAQANLYGTISGGYGSYSHILEDDRTTGVIRFSLGLDFLANPNTSLGLETGIQTGNRMRIDSSNAVDAIGVAPVFLEIKPVIDLLATVKFFSTQFKPNLFLKGGIAYAEGMIDSITIPNKNQLLPELQIGTEFGLTTNYSLIVYYQNQFGGQARLEHIDLNNGSAQLSRIPSFQAGFIGLRILL